MIKCSTFSAETNAYPVHKHNNKTYSDRRLILLLAILVAAQAMDALEKQEELLKDKVILDEICIYLNFLFCQLLPC